MRKSTRNLLLAGIVAGIVVALSLRSSINFQLVPLDYMIRLVNLARSSAWISVAFYFLFGIAVMFLPVTLFPIIGGVLFPFWIALPLNLLATTLGAWFSFRVTRFFGRKTVESLLKGKIRSLDKITGAQGFKTVLLLRFVGVPPFLVCNYGLGFSAVNNFDFLLGTALGVLPWMSIITFLSHSLWEAVLVGGQKGLAAALFEAMLPLMILSGIVTAALVVKYFMNMNKKRHRRQSNL